MALFGDVVRSQLTFHEIDAQASGMNRILELRTRLMLDASDREALHEQQRLIASLSRKSAEVDLLPADLARRGSDQTPGERLYAEHCSACHGKTGRGDGAAARHVYPRPRDLRRGKMRLVSARNGVPTPGDVERVTKLGMPGTAMPAYERLTDNELDQLAKVVLTMRCQGLREQLQHRAELAGEVIDDDELAEIVGFRTTPEAPVVVPPLGPPDAESIARGKQLFVSQACASCHGDTGEGDNSLPLFDDEGHPVVPRNLVRDPMKGGDDPASLYVRILLGMPGSPHPATIAAEVELIDLVHYCTSLAKEPKRFATNYERAMEAYSRPVLDCAETPRTTAWTARPASELELLGSSDAFLRTNPVLSRAGCRPRSLRQRARRHQRFGEQSVGGT
jgi:mono/diheme cytochrome c family protein